MPAVSATHQLRASREDVWRLLSQPSRLADWWPGIGAVEASRQGLLPGARWRVEGSARPSLVRRPDATGTLLVLQVQPPELVRWQLTGERIDVELRLAEEGEERTRAELTIEGPLLIGLRRSLPRIALSRLFALCQTAPGSERS